MSYVTDYAPLIAALVAVAGWRVANKQANRRELRKEIREEITEIRKSIDRICAAVRNFQNYDRNSRDAALSTISVQQDFALLDLRLGRLRERLIKPSTRVFLTGLQNAQEDFFDISTGDLIDPSVQSQADEIEALILRQIGAAGALEHLLAQIFASEFQAN